MIAKTILLKKVLARPSELGTSADLVDAFRTLVNHGLIQDIESNLWTFLENAQESDQLRLEAAMLLMPYREEQIMDYLNKVFLNRD